MKITEPPLVTTPMRYHGFREGDVLKRAGGCYPHVCFLVVNAPVPQKKFDVFMFEYSTRWRGDGNDPQLGWNVRFIDQCRPDMCDYCCYSCGKLKSEHAGKNCLFTSTLYEEIRIAPELACEGYRKYLTTLPQDRWIEPPTPEEMQSFLDRLGWSVRHLVRR